MSVHMYVVGVKKDGNKRALNVHTAASSRASAIDLVRKAYYLPPSAIEFARREKPKRRRR